MKINTVDTVIQDFRDGQNIFRRSSVELMVREISRLNKRIAELEHYKRLNEEWVHEKVEGLTTLEEIEKMVMIADKLNKSNASIRCGWCDAEFDTRDQVKEHAYECKDNPLSKDIHRYQKLITNLFVFLEDRKSVV